MMNKDKHNFVHTINCLREYDYIAKDRYNEPIPWPGADKEPFFEEAVEWVEAKRKLVGPNHWINTKVPKSFIEKVRLS